VFDRRAYGSLPDQFGEYGAPEGGHHRPIVTLIHGGFWREQYQLGLMHPLAESLHALGYPTWNIEYRRVGASGGGFPTTLDDVAAAIDYLDVISQDDHVEWQGHVVVGHSAGGHLALWNASREGSVRPDLTVGLAPVADVIAANRNGVGRDATANFFDGNYDDVPDRYAQAQPDVAAFAGRVVVVHGTDDEQVPLEQSTNLIDQVARVVELDGVDHFDVINPEHASWDLVLAEIAEL